MSPTQTRWKEPLSVLLCSSVRNHLLSGRWGHHHVYVTSFITQKAHSIRRVTRFLPAAPPARGASSRRSGAPGAAGAAHPAAVAVGVEEAAVAGVTGVAAGQRVAQARLLVGDAAARRAHGAALELHRRRVLGTGSQQEVSRKYTGRKEEVHRKETRSTPEGTRSNQEGNRKYT
ncbi:hypothetical protein EYF80_058606 [Liparis tanakae]|uniref:Uncharacterized protein n=1 Tax=Liparis tanakae TaxID=230148 RepID=A0A4Z2ER23_9TELE|nr:hypothetical protein EYF80_058606 [Liparis tanakae]